MPHEHRRPYRSTEEIFGLTDKERLWDRVGDKRFQALLSDPQTTIHRVELSVNNFGEYLFVTLSREGDGRGQC